MTKIHFLRFLSVCLLVACNFRNGCTDLDGAYTSWQLMLQEVTYATYVSEINQILKFYFNAEETREGAGNS